MYTLVYQNNKKYQGGGGPLCPMRWPPFPKLITKYLVLEDKYIAITSVLFKKNIL